MSQKMEIDCSGHRIDTTDVLTDNNIDTDRVQVIDITDLIKGKTKNSSKSENTRLR